MALSDREKKVLEELERNLFANDEDFAKRVGASSAKESNAKHSEPKPKSAPAARLVGGALLAVVGLSVLVMAAVSQFVVVGVVGFVITLTGMVIASSNWSNSSLQQKKSSTKRAPSAKSFIEDRWDRRMNGEN